MQQFNEAADAAEVDIPIGDVFEICLNENPTTGFRWNLESRGEPTCNLVKEFFSPISNAPGSPGTHHWNFKVVMPGTSTVGLAYRRHWQRVPPARTFTLTIRAGE
jgi:inhibitor of cysteine peptidase